MKRSLALRTLLAALGMVATSVTAPAPAFAQPRTVKIAVIAKSEANFVFLAARRGAEDKAAALSRQHGATIQVSWLTPAKEDVAQQAERIRQAVRERADAILLAASDERAEPRRPCALADVADLKRTGARGPSRNGNDEEVPRRTTQYISLAASLGPGAMT